MGTTTDAHGHELTYHTLQSIERPEWPATPGMLRQHTASPRGGHAKKFSALMDEADCHQWLPSSMVCHVCVRKPKLGSYPLCLGCPRRFYCTTCQTCLR
ncbi:unnamed protein product [Peronospora effusa]|nr:unnamed protein product [Peronospora effusa]